MLKSKHTKLALLSSAVSLLICCAMLAGTTFAWFTDSVVNTGNRIQSGQLDVRFTGNRLEDGGWVTVQHLDRGALFQEENWEPGQYGAVVINVSNWHSSLAAKVDVKFNITEGEDTLANALWYRLTPFTSVSATPVRAGVDTMLIPAEDRPVDRDNPDVKPMTEIEGESNPLTLLAGAVGQREIYGYFLLEYGMYASAGKDYMGTSFGLDFTVNATQAPVEEDGFGDNQYDAGAMSAWNADAATDEEMAAITDDTAKTVSISTGRQLAGLAAQVNAGNTYEGYTVILLNDINLGNRPWMPIGNAETPAGSWDGAAFSGSFDGNGKTISNLYIDQGEKTADVGFFGMLKLTPDAFIRDITFENAYVDGEKAEGVGVLAGAASGGVYNDLDNYMPCLIENVTVTGATVMGRKYVGGVIGYSTTCLKNVTVSDANVSARYNAQLVDSGENAGAIVGDLYALFSIDGAKVSDSVVSGSAKVSAVAGSAHNADYIRNCTVTGVKMFIDEASNDDRFGWITGRAAKINEAKYTNNTVSDCVATKNGQTVSVEDVHWV